MKRTNIHLPERQRAALLAQSRQTGLKVAELVRRYIDAGLESVERRGRRPLTRKDSLRLDK